MSANRPTLPLVQSLTHITIVLLITVALLSPVPLSFSEMNLLSVQPIYSNSTTNSIISQAGPVFGGNGTVSLSNVTSTTPSPSSNTTAVMNTSAPTPMSSSQTSPALSFGPSTNTSANSTASTAKSLPTPFAADGRIYRRHSGQRRELQTRTFVQSSTLTANESNPSTAAQSSGPLSKVHLTFGPLGSCFADAKGNKVCTSAKLTPQYVSSGLADPKVGPFNIDGLPHSMSTTPVLILIVLCSLIISAAISITACLAEMFPAKYAMLLEGGPHARALLSARQYSLWLMMATSLLYLITSIALRIIASRAVSAFNSANDGIKMVASATVDGQSTSVGLQAATGKTFGILWTSAGLLTILIIIERKRLRNANAVQQARADMEALHGRMAFEGKVPMQRQPSTRAPSIYSAEPYSHSAFSHSGVSVLDVQRGPSPAPTQRTYLEPDDKYWQRQYAYGRTPYGQTYQPDPYVLDALYHGRKGEAHSDSGHSEAMSWRLIGDHSGQIYN